MTALGYNWRKLRPLLAGIASGQRANLPPALVHEVQRGYDEHLAIENEALLPMCARAADAGGADGDRRGDGGAPRRLIG